MGGAFQIQCQQTAQNFFFVVEDGIVPAVGVTNGFDKLAVGVLEAELCLARNKRD